MWSFVRIYKILPTHKMQRVERAHRSDAEGIKCVLPVNDAPRVSEPRYNIVAQGPQEVELKVVGVAQNLGANKFAPIARINTSVLMPSDGI